MAITPKNFQIRGGGQHPPPDFSTGLIAAPQRLVGSVPQVELAQLPLGSFHLTLPEWTPTAGPSVFQIIGNDGDGGTILTGMGLSPAETEIAATAVEYAILGVLIAILNVGSSAFSTSANDDASPVGSQFASAVTVDPGTVQTFICGERGDGTKAWFPQAGGGGGGGGVEQCFLYVATGAEGADFVIDLPTAQADVNFGATVTGGGLAFQLTFDVVIADNAIGHIHVKSSAVLTEGDTLVVTTKPLTA